MPKITFSIKKKKLNLYYPSIRSFLGCKTKNEQIEKILQFLRKQGLEGEPTTAKCKQLKEDLRIRKEVEELDKSVIIEAEDGGKLGERDHI